MEHCKVSDFDIRHTDNTLKSRATNINQMSDIGLVKRAKMSPSLRNSSVKADLKNDIAGDIFRR